jgi:hypothetical protein
MRTAALSSREKKEWKRVLVSGWRRGLGLGCGLDPVNTARTRVAFGISVNDIMGPCGNRAIGEVAAVDLDPINLFFCLPVGCFASEKHGGWAVCGFLFLFPVFRRFWVVFSYYSFSYA